LLDTCRLDNQRGFEIKKSRMSHSWRHTRKFRKVKSFGKRFHNGPSYTTDTLYLKERTSRLTTTKTSW